MTSQTKIPTIFIIILYNSLIYVFTFFIDYFVYLLLNFHNNGIAWGQKSCFIFPPLDNYWLSSSVSETKEGSNQCSLDKENTLSKFILYGSSGHSVSLSQISIEVHKI